MPDKTPIKTPERRTKPSSRNGNTLPLGNHPGNTGGKKGRSGRRPASFGAFLKTLRDSENVHAAITRAAEDEESRGFAPVLKLAADYDDEKPAEKKQIVGPIVIQVEFVHEGRKNTAG